MPSITRMFGIELEFFLVDHKGNVVNTADRMIRDLKLSNTELKQEAGKSMIEMVTFPHRSSHEVFNTFFKDMEKVLFETELNEQGLFYYGTYPGKNANEPRSSDRYKVIADVLGEKQIQQAGRCIGFHYHWSLPRNTMNHHIRYFYPDIKPRKQHKIRNLHNLYVALDPAITTLMQSSPYYEQQYLGKDARMIVYRGDPVFNYPHGRFSKYPEFGKLNEYEETFSSLTNTIKERSLKWKKLLEDHNYTYQDFAKKQSSYLDSTWQPVKISTHGTIESRGCDMNSLSKTVALSSVLKHLSKHVQNNMVQPVPSEIGDAEPFALEEEILHVPRYATLSELQKHSAFDGLKNPDVHRYAKRLMKLLKSIIRVEDRTPLRDFQRMLADKKTTSDNIIDFVKRKQGYTDTIEQETAQELAIQTSQQMYKDLVITKQLTEKTRYF